MSRTLGAILLLVAVSSSAVGCHKNGIRTNKRTGAGQAGESGQGVDAGGPSSGDAAAEPGKDGEHGVGDDVSKKTDDGPATSGTATEFLTWKRYRAFESGLMSGLELKKTEVCTELGRGACVDQVHLAVLGGNEPYVSAQYERVRAPTILTSIAVERVVLAACERRLDMDRELGANAVVFKYWSAGEASVTEDKIKEQTRELYRRLLARDATDDELTASADILKIVTAPDKVALSLCFVVGTQVENVFL